MEVAGSQPVAPGAASFLTSGSAYDSFMGRYSQPLARLFADELGVKVGQRVLDVGCGPGALTTELVSRLGAESVFACDPSQPFVIDCQARNPGVDVRLGRAEAIPFDDASVDVVMAQLVLHFVTDPLAAAAEMRRVVRPGGIVGACVWDFERGMEMLRHFWDAALLVDPSAPDEARHLKFGRKGEISELLNTAGCEGVVETALAVSTTYVDFAEMWKGFLAGIGPAGSYLLTLPEARRNAVRVDLMKRVGSPSGPFSLQGVARCAYGLTPN
jgi:SAM-dependent methyltransferase